MQNKKLIRFVESFILLPIVSLSMPFGNVPKPVEAPIEPATQIVSSQKSNIEADGILAFNQVMDQKAQDQKAKAEAIDAYFRARNMPLEGYGEKFVLEAEKNDLDWRLLAAISVIETTGGKFSCQGAYKRTGNIEYTYNPFGWGSCKIPFESIDKAIETVGHNLGGNNPNTDHHYAGKETKAILQTYNPPSIVPDYAQKVMKVMNGIGENPTYVAKI